MCVCSVYNRMIGTRNACNWRDSFCACAVELHFHKPPTLCHSFHPCLTYISTSEKTSTGDETQKFGKTKLVCVYSSLEVMLRIRLELSVPKYFYFHLWKLTNSLSLWGFSNYKISCLSQTFNVSIINVEDLTICTLDILHVRFMQSVKVGKPYIRFLQ